jgi:hypothetical protein
MEETIISQPEEKKTHWKFYVGVILIVLNFVFGFIGKVSIVELFVNGKINWSFTIIYLVSWFMLFVGIFLLGKETMEIVDAYIKRRVKEAVDKASSEGKRHMINVRNAMGKAAVESKRQMTNVRNAADTAYGRIIKKKNQ